MPEKSSVLLLLLDIIDRPGRALANIIAYPRWRWLLPTILALAALTASAVLLAPLTSAETQRLLAEQMARLPSEQADMIRAQVERFQSPAFVILSGLAGGAFLLLLGWLSQATILYFGALIAGSDLEFKRLFAAIPWVNLPFALETALQTVFSLSRNELIVNQGLSYLVSTGKPLDDVRNLAYVALSQVSLFRLWHAILVYVLFRVGVKLGAGASFWLTVIYLAAAVGVQLATAALGASLTPTF